MPTLLPLDFTKIDIPKLTADMPKWYAVMPTSAKEWWESFLTKLDPTASHASAEDSCPILTLKHNVQRPSKVTDETADISTQILELREKELEPLEEVG